jgi:Arm DNA-binding domain
MLTDTVCRNLKPKAKPYKSDGGGLRLVVQPNGSKLWRMAYRFGGKQKELAFGSYPAISLAGTRSCSSDAPISDNTLCKRLCDLGYDTATEHCAHGFRTTFSTLCNAECDRNENKMWDSDMIELQLAHLDESSVKAIYNRTGRPQPSFSSAVFIGIRLRFASDIGLYSQMTRGRPTLPP